MVEFPDFWGYTRLEYGNRGGLERVARVLEAAGVAVSCAVNSDVSMRYSAVVAEARDRGWEIIGHGTSSSIVIHDGMRGREEETLVHDALSSLREATGEPIRGWLSPSMSESQDTLDVLAACGVEYVLDWVNDDLPYELATTSGPLLSIPYAYELNDLYVLGEVKQTTWDYVDQVIDGARCLAAESRVGAGRSMCLAIHPWIMGVPHRVGYFESLLTRLRELSGVWWATPGDIADAYMEITAAGRQQGAS